MYLNNFTRSLAKLPQLIPQIKLLSNNIDFQKKIELIIGSLDFNQFLTIFDVEKNDFSFYCNIESVTGYTADEFTENSFNNRHFDSIDSKENLRRPILYEEDLPHFQRFAYFLYTLVSSPNIFISPFEDYAILKFRMYKKNGELVGVTYQTYNADVENGSGLKLHLDVWTIFPLKDSDDFIPSMSFHSKNYQKIVDAVLNKISKNLYGFKLSKMEIKVYSKLKNGLTRKEIANLLNISEGTVNTHFNNIKDKINTYLISENNTPITNLKEVIKYVELFNLKGF